MLDSVVSGGAVALISLFVGYLLAGRTDRRQRWWDALMWVWDNREHLPPDRVIALLDALNDLSRTKEQSAMLESVMDAALPDRGV